MNKPLICSLIALSIFLFSCNKADPINQPERSNLTGNWNLIESAVDSNRNNVLDESEKMPHTNILWEWCSYYFKFDHTVEIISGDVGYTGRWQLKDNNQVLEISFDDIFQSYKILQMDGRGLRIEGIQRDGLTYWMKFQRK